MPDPLSIAAGVVGLLNLTGCIANGLRKFHGAASVVDKTVSDLQHDVESLQRVLESMQATFEIVTPQGETGYIGQLWNHVAKSMTDGSDILGRIHRQIEDIDKDVSILPSHRKQLRLERAQPQLAGFRVHFQDFKDGLDISLSAIVIWNQDVNQRAADQVVRDLSELSKDVRRLDLVFSKRLDQLQLNLSGHFDQLQLNLNRRFDRLESRLLAQNDNEPRTDAPPPTGISPQTEINALQNLKECVKTAASTISSASTIRTSNRHSLAPDGTILGSELTGYFTSSGHSNVRRWMEYTTEDGTSTVRPDESVTEVDHVSDDADDGSDSDNEPDNQMMLALFEVGRQKAAAGANEGALKFLQKCLDSVESADATRHFGRVTLQREVIDVMISIYTTRENWSQPQEMCRRKLRIEERSPSRNPSQHIADLLKLAEVTMHKGDLDESVLQARRAFKQSSKTKSPSDASACLTLLIELSKKSGDEVEAEAYSLMLSRVERIEDNSKSMGSGLLTEVPAASVQYISASEGVAWVSDPLSKMVDVRETVNSGSEKGQIVDNPVSPTPQPRLRSRLKSESPAQSMGAATTVQPAAQNEAREIGSLKVVVTGDGAKTKLLASLTTGTGPHDVYVPTVFDNYSLERTIDGTKVILRFWDTAGQEDYDRLRPLSYPQTDVFLLVFSVVSPVTFSNITKKWYPEITHHAPGVPLILIGLEVELRDDPEIVETLSKRKMSPITREQGEEVRKRIAAQVYIECNLNTNTGLSEILGQIGLALSPQPQALRRSKRDNSWSASSWKRLRLPRQTLTPRS